MVRRKILRIASLALSCYLLFALLLSSIPFALSMDLPKEGQKLPPLEDPSLGGGSIGPYEDFGCVTLNATDIGTESATFKAELTGSLLSGNEVYYYFNYYTDENGSENYKKTDTSCIQGAISGTIIAARVYGLTSGEQYYYKAFVKTYNQDQMYEETGNQVCFLTKPYEPLNATIVNQTDLSISLSIVKASVGIGTSNNLCIRYSNISYPETVDGDGPGLSTNSETAEIGGLKPSTLYYFSIWSYAVDNHESQYSDYFITVSGYTRPESPQNFTALNSNSILLAWDKGEGANTTIIRRALETTPLNLTDGVLIYNGTGTNYTDENLTPGTAYYYNAWSYNSNSGLYSSSLIDNRVQEEEPTCASSPNEPAYDKPIVKTNGSNNVENTSATLNGFLESDGNASTTCGYRYGLVSGEYDNNVTIGIMDEESEYYLNISNLMSGHVYYYQAWANNSEGFAVGEELMLLTKPNSLTLFMINNTNSSYIELIWEKPACGNNVNLSIIIIRNSNRYIGDYNDGTIVYEGVNTSYNDCFDMEANITYYYQGRVKVSFNDLIEYSEIYLEDNITIEPEEDLIPITNSQRIQEPSTHHTSTNSGNIDEEDENTEINETIDNSTNNETLLEYPVNQSSEKTNNYTSTEFISSLGNLTDGRKSTVNVSNNKTFIKKVEVTPKTKINNVEISITNETENKPMNVLKEPDLKDLKIKEKNMILKVKVYRYVDIKLTSNEIYVDEDSIGSLNFNFHIEKSWFEENEIDFESITMLRYHNDEWQSLDTEQVSDDSTYYYFEAATPGLSTFAVVGSNVVGGEDAQKQEGFEVPWIIIMMFITIALVILSVILVKKKYIYVDE
jgi:PGF-pre-PGF domain-containing protein